MKPQTFTGEFELAQGKIIAKLPPELVHKYKITTDTKYRIISEKPKKVALLLE